MAFYILDVSGHGVAAALDAVAASYLLKPSATETILKPSIVLTQLNSRLSGSSNVNFTTVFYGVLNIEELTLTYGLTIKSYSTFCTGIMIMSGGAIKDTDKSCYVNA